MDERRYLLNPLSPTQSPVIKLRGWLWLTLTAAVGVTLCFLYQDSYQQDAPTHYLFARWAWKHPMDFVSVWGRPLFTFLYAFPALISYRATKLFTVVISVATAWQTWQLARQLACKRSELVIPFLFLQPSFLLLCADTMTEPLFALVLVVALRLHLCGRLLAGMLMASLLPLARPEGFFLCALWGIWMLFEQRAARTLWQRLPLTLILVSGTFLWAFAAVWIMNDPLWLIHNWPQNWQADASYGSASYWWYVHKSSWIFGLLLRWPFLIGLLVLLWTRRFLTGVSAFVTIFALHSILFARGAFGSAGYPRYFVCVAPVIAIITLAGWNTCADFISRPLRQYAPPVMGLLLAVVMLLNGLHALHYVDGWGFARDVRAVNEMHEWFQRHAAATHPVTRLVWSQAYMCVAFDRDIWEKPFLSYERESNLALLPYLPPGTLIFWDDETGPGWYQMTAADFAVAGFTELHKQEYQFDGWFFARKWKEHGGTRQQKYYLFYKQPPGMTMQPAASQ